MGVFAELSRRHEVLKKQIHSFKIPIKSRSGLFAMSVFYFCGPCALGYLLYQFTEDQRRKNLGEKGELLNIRRRVGDGVKQPPPPKPPQTLQ